MSCYYDYKPKVLRRGRICSIDFAGGTWKILESQVSFNGVVDYRLERKEDGATAWVKDNYVNARGTNFFEAMRDQPLNIIGNGFEPRT